MLIMRWSDTQATFIDVTGGHIGSSFGHLLSPSPSHPWFLHSPTSLPQVPAPCTWIRMSCLPSRYHVSETEPHTRTLKPNCRKKGNVHGMIRKQFKISFTGSFEGLIWAKQAGRLLLKSPASGFSTSFVEHSIKFPDEYQRSEFRECFLELVCLVQILPPPLINDIALDQFLNLPTLQSQFYKQEFNMIYFIRLFWGLNEIY